MLQPLLALKFFIGFLCFYVLQPPEFMLYLLFVDGYGLNGIPGGPAAGGSGVNSKLTISSPPIMTCSMIDNKDDDSVTHPVILI